MDANDDARREHHPIGTTEIVTMAGAIALIAILLLFILAAM